MERHLMPASAETEPVEVNYGTNSCNAVVYGDLAVWAKPFTLSLHVGTNIKSVAASIKTRITGLDDPAPSGSSTSDLNLGTKWHDTVEISCTPKDPATHSETDVKQETRYIPHDPYTQTTYTVTKVNQVTSTTNVYTEVGRNEDDRNVYVRTDTSDSRSEVVITADNDGYETLTIHYDINAGEGGYTHGSVPTVQYATRYWHDKTTKTLYYHPRYYQPQHRTRVYYSVQQWLITTWDERTDHTKRECIDTYTKTVAATYSRNVTTTYSFSKWTFHGTSTQASGTQNTTISDLASNMNYDAIGNAVNDDPEWNHVSDTDITGETYYTTTYGAWVPNPPTPTWEYGKRSEQEQGSPWSETTDTGWYNVGSEFIPEGADGKDYYDEGGVTVLHYREPVTLTTETPIGGTKWEYGTLYRYYFDYWMEGSTTGTRYDSGESYDRVNNNVTFYAHWTAYPETTTS